MKYNDGRGIKTQQWYANELFKNDDINLVGKQTYQLMTDKLASLSKQDVYAEVIRGLDLTFSSGFTATLESGAVVSYEGPYMQNDTWGFVSQAGTPFSVIVPEDASVAFDNAVGQTGDRRDSLEIRPIEIDYNNLSRKFKDPVTGLISSAPVDTSKEYGFEFFVRKGTAVDFAVKSIQFPAFSGSNYTGVYVDIKLQLSTAGPTYRKNIRLWFLDSPGKGPSASVLTTMTEGDYTYLPIIVENGDSATDIATKVQAAINGIASGNSPVTVSRSTDTVTFTGVRGGDLQFTGTATTVLAGLSTVTAGGVVDAPAKTAGWIKIAEVLIEESATDIDASGGEPRIFPVSLSDQWSAAYTTIIWEMLSRLDELEATSTPTYMGRNNSALSAHRAIGYSFDGNIDYAGFYATRLTDPSGARNQTNTDRLIHIGNNMAVDISMDGTAIIKARVLRLTEAGGIDFWPWTTLFSSQAVSNSIISAVNIYADGYFLLSWYDTTAKTVVMSVIQWDFATRAFIIKINKQVIQTLTTGPATLTPKSLAYPAPWDKNCTLFIYNDADATDIQVAVLYYDGSTLAVNRTQWPTGTNINGYAVRLGNIVNSAGADRRMWAALLFGTSSSAHAETSQLLTVEAGVGVSPSITNLVSTNTSIAYPGPDTFGNLSYYLDLYENDADLYSPGFSSKLRFIGTPRAGGGGILFMEINFSKTVNNVIEGSITMSQQLYRQGGGGGSLRVSHGGPLSDTFTIMISNTDEICFTVYEWGLDSPTPKVISIYKGTHPTLSASYKATMWHQNDIGGILHAVISGSSQTSFYFPFRIAKPIGITKIAIPAGNVDINDIVMLGEKKLFTSDYGRAGNAAYIDLAAQDGVPVENTGTSNLNAFLWKIGKWLTSKLLIVDPD